jgi:hypothetical protein
VTALAELQRALTEPGDSPLPRAVLELRPDAGEEGAVKQQLARMLYQTTVLKRFSHANEFRFKDVDALYGEAIDSDCPDYLADSLNYLRIYQVLADRLRALNLGEEKWFGTRVPREAAPDLIAAIEGLGRFDPKLPSSMLVLGKLHALHSRKAACEQFAAAITRFRAGQDLLAREGGASTYFDQATMEGEAGTVGERREALPPKEEYGSIGLDGVRHLCLFSCEERFLRIYLPYWLSIAEYLKPLGFAYHVLITAPSSEAASMVEDAEASLRALAKLRDANPATFGDNISFSSVAVPSWCADERAYSACARYLYARELSERTGMRVIVQDIDLVVSFDPSPWFEAMPVDRIVLGSYSPDLSIDPWRKFSAGVFGLPHDEAAFELMRVIEDYLLEGLGQQASWYLDQNALAYLHDVATQEGERVDDLLFSLDDQRAGLPQVPGGLRPIHMLPVHGLFEKHARASID